MKTRELLFRGLRQDCDEWTYGHYVELPDGYTNTYEGRYCRDHVHFIFSIKDNEIKRFEVRKETVGQYIDLVDRTSVEIFEGDLLFWPASDICEDNFVTWEVKWYKDSSRFIMVNSRFPEQIEDCIVSYVRPMFVVGNIHQESDLLETAKARRLLY